MTEIFKTAYDFFSNYGWQSAFGISLVFNIYLVIAWTKREKHMELVEIAMENFMPKIKFELNKDEKFKTIANENIKLKAENTILKGQNDNIPYIILFVLLIVAMIGSTINKTKNKSEINEQDINSDSPVINSEEQEVSINDEDYFNLENTLEKVNKIKNSIKQEK